MDLNGISAIVTGGASGLGAATATPPGRRAGAKVVIADLDRQADKGEALAKELGGVFAPTDVTDTEQVIAAVEAAKELGPLRGLVTAAGIGWATRTIGQGRRSTTSAHDLGMFKKVIEINLVGTFNCIRLAATAMSQTEPLDDGERGAIVTVASVAAFDGQIGQASYSASKGGVVGMTLPVARDLVGGRRAGQLHRPRPDRHADLRRRARAARRSRRSSSATCCSPSASAPPTSSPAMAVELLAQQLHERRGHPGRRRRPHAAQVS